MSWESPSLPSYFNTSYLQVHTGRALEPVEFVVQVRDNVSNGHNKATLTEANSLLSVKDVCRWDVGCALIDS